MRAYWHVFVAFAVAWALLFGYVVALGRRFGSLEREIRRLEGTGV
ncbi:MAG: CcmD family protein [Gemmatimonadetes bacterium]|nr:CcmD family protein [Gemmatimonadota bacterium]